jgi:hypothetical protein
MAIPDRLRVAGRDRDQARLQPKEDLHQISAAGTMLGGRCVDAR